jgi:hypothetical protein
MPLRPVILAALQAAGLFVAGLLIPLLGQIAVVFVPVPLAAVGILHGRKEGAVAAGLSAVLVGAVSGGHPVTVLVFISLALMSLGLAEGIVRRMRPENVVLLAGILPLAPIALFLVPLLLKTGQHPVQYIEEHLRQNLTEVQGLYTRMGLTEVSGSIAAVSDVLVFYLARLVPGIFLTTSLMQSATCYGAARMMVLRRSPGSPLSAGPSLAVWHAPDTWVWGLIASLGLIAVFPKTSAAWFFGMNAAILFVLIYIVQGIAVIEYFQRKARIPAFWRSLLHAVILALPTVVAVIAFGIVDIWGDFRKIRAAGPGPS